MKILTALIAASLIAYPVKAQIDYSEDTPFKRVFNASTIEEKKTILQTLTDEERYEVWNQDILWAKQFLALNEDQEEFLDEFLTSLPTMTEEKARELERDSVVLPKNKADLIFAIGPYQPSCGMVKIRFFKPNCWCSVGSSFNMSCDDTCAGQGGGCNSTEDGCGFAYLWSCDGGCNDGLPHNDLTG